MARRKKKKSKLFSVKLALFIGIVIVIILAIAGTSGNVSNFYTGALKQPGTSGKPAISGGSNTGTSGIFGSGQPIVKTVPENTAATCSDRYDNDIDKLIDCADPDCNGMVCGASVACKPGCSGGGDSRCKNSICQSNVIPCKETNCADKIDNDADGFTDCADAECYGLFCAFAQCPQGSIGGGVSYSCTMQLGGSCVTQLANSCVENLCSDTVDNDLDNAIDNYDCDCPSVDITPINAEKTYNYTDHYSYYYKIFVKNKGTSNGGDSISVRVYGISEGVYSELNSYCEINGGIKAGATSSCTTHSFNNLSSIHVVVLYGGYHGADCNISNNIADFNV